MDVSIGQGRYRYLISGNVQKVRYRDYLAGNAESLSLTGEVYNRHGGKVEIILEGEIEDLEKFDKVMQGDKKRGTASSRLCLATNIEYELFKEQYTGLFPTFDISYSTSYQEELNEQFGAAMAAMVLTNTSINELTTAMTGSFDNLDEKYHVISEDLHTMSEDIHTMSDNLDSLPDRISTKLCENLPRKMAEELVTVLKNQKS